MAKLPRIVPALAIVAAVSVGAVLSAQQGRVAITSNARYSPLTQINASNATSLGLAWTYVMGAGGGNQEGTPLFWNNTLYGITTWSVVFALDARTGKELWRWDPQVEQPKTRPAICCGNVNRGIALYRGATRAPAGRSGRPGSSTPPNCTH